MGDKENVNEKPSEASSSQQNSTQNEPDRPQSYGTVPLQKGLTNEQPLKKDN